MRMQSTEAACGPAAVANVCKALGLADVTEAMVLRWVEKVRGKDQSGWKGTSEIGLARALTEAAPKRYRLAARTLHLHDPADAQAALRGYLEAGSGVVLAVDPEELEGGGYAASHWVGAVGRVGARFLIADAAETELVLSYSPSQLLTRWELPGNPRVFYGLVITRQGKDDAQ